MEGKRRLLRLPSPLWTSWWRLAIMLLMLVPFFLVLLLPWTRLVVMILGWTTTTTTATATSSSSSSSSSSLSDFFRNTIIIRRTATKTTRKRKNNNNRRVATTTTCPTISTYLQTPSFFFKSQQQQRYLSKLRHQRTTTTSNVHHANRTFGLNGICSRFSLTSTTIRGSNNNNNNNNKRFTATTATGTTASSLWRRYAADLVEASIHPKDAVNRTHAVWTKHLFQLLPPHLLQAGIRSQPHAATWKSILRKLAKRYNDNDDEETKRARAVVLPDSDGTTTSNRRRAAVQVAVFGGSVAFGSECHLLPQEVYPFLPLPNTTTNNNNTRKRKRRNKKPIIPPGLLPHIYETDCSWPIRLQFLFDSILGPNMVKVHNFAVGGTNSASALPRIQYRLYQTNDDNDDEDIAYLIRHGPDVIINAYAANDSYYTIWHLAKQALQAFTTTCLEASSSSSDRNNPDNMNCHGRRGNINNNNGNSSTGGASDGGTSRTGRSAQTTTAASDHEHPLADTTTATTPSSHQHQHIRPLVLYFNDYIGNYGDVLLQEHLYHTAVQEDARYYGTIGYVSTASVIQSLVYANAHEALLSPPWWNDRGVRIQEVHFGMPGHVARAWIMAYALLEWTLQACQDDDYDHDYDYDDRYLNQYPQQQQQKEEKYPNDKNEPQNPKRQTSTNIRANTRKRDNPSSSSTTTTIPMKPKKSWNWTNSIAIPPSLDFWTPSLLSWANSSLSFDTLSPLSVVPLHFNQITLTWKQQAAKHIQDEEELECQMDNVPLCSLAFVAAPSGTIRTKPALTRFIRSRVVKSNEGWGADTNVQFGWHTKLGMAAMRPRARIVFQVDHLVSPIQVLTIHYLKSYGEKWANSTLRCTFNVWKGRRKEQRQQQLKSSTVWELEGYHDKNSSISYHFRKDLGPDYRAEMGDVAELELELIGGTTFKIISLMMCLR